MINIRYRNIYYELEGGNIEPSVGTIESGYQRIGNEEGPVQSGNVIIFLRIRRQEGRQGEPSRWVAKG